MVSATLLALGSGAAFGADTLFWRAGAPSNRWAGLSVRGGVEMAVLLLGLLISRQPSGLDAKNTALMGGSGLFVAVGVVLLGMALKDSVGPSVVMSSIAQAAVAFGGGALFFKEKPTMRKVAGLVVGAAGVALIAA